MQRFKWVEITTHCSCPPPPEPVKSCSRHYTPQTKATIAFSQYDNLKSQYGKGVFLEVYVGEVIMGKWQHVANNLKCRLEPAYRFRDLILVQIYESEAQ